MDKTEDSDLVKISGINNSINNINNKINFNEIRKENSKIRYDIFDNLKGILIFTVVFAHFLFEYSTLNIESLSRKIVIFIYTFHMPSFIFISGFLTSENSIKIKNDIKKIVNKNNLKEPFLHIKNLPNNFF